MSNICIKNFHRGKFASEWIFFRQNRIVAHTCTLPHPPPPTRGVRERMTFCLPVWAISGHSEPLWAIFEPFRPPLAVLGHFWPPFFGGAINCYFGRNLALQNNPNLLRMAENGQKCSKIGPKFGVINWSKWPQNGSKSSKMIRKRLVVAGYGLKCPQKSQNGLKSLATHFRHIFPIRNAYSHIFSAHLGVFF